MALPTSGPISTNDIMGPNGLNIGVQSISWPALWAQAVAGSVPKNKANAGGPYVLPNDWYGYNAAVNPPGPFTLTPVSSTQTSNTMSWTQPTSNGGIQNYKLYRDGVYIKSMPPYSVTDTGLAIGTAYSYFVRATDTFGAFTDSNTIVMTTSSSYSYLSLGYEGTGNAFAARFSGQTFQYSRVNANTNSSPGNWVIAQCHAGIPANFTFPTARGFMGFNTSSITSASSGGIKINLASSGQNNDNSLQAATRFVLVATNGSHPPNYVFTGSDYTTGLIGGTGGGTQLYSEIVTISPGQTGDILIPFNAQGIGTIVAFSSISLVLMEYDHDWLNIAPTIQYSYNNFIRAASANVKLYYSI